MTPIKKSDYPLEEIEGYSLPGEAMTPIVDQHNGTIDLLDGAGPITFKRIKEITAAVTSTRLVHLGKGFCVDAGRVTSLQLREATVAVCYEKVIAGITYTITHEFRSADDASALRLVRKILRRVNRGRTPGTELGKPSWHSEAIERRRRMNAFIREASKPLEGANYSNAHVTMPKSMAEARKAAEAMMRKYAMLCTFFECRKCFRTGPASRVACPSCDPEAAKANPPERNAIFEYGQAVGLAREKAALKAVLGVDVTTFEDVGSGSGAGDSIVAGACVCSTADLMTSGCRCGATGKTELP
jgi:hypothetical protein